MAGNEFAIVACENPDVAVVPPTPRKAAHEGKRFAPDEACNANRDAWQPGFLLSALMFRVLCGRWRRMPLSLHAKFSGSCKSLLFTMSRLDFAGEFRREVPRTMGQTAGHWIGLHRRLVPALSRDRSRLGHLERSPLFAGTCSGTVPDQRSTALQGAARGTPSGTQASETAH